MTSLWDEHDIEAKVIQILSDVSDYAPGHHLGRPFLTAYQIAIAFAQRYPDAFERIGLPVGGLDTGQRDSLARYLANQLSRKIKAGHIPEIEGGFLSNDHLDDVRFVEADGTIIRSSLTGTSFTLSMFRLRDS
jgi:hypothetical protein